MDTSAQPTAASPTLPDVYCYPSYVLRRKMLVLLGARIDIYAPNGAQLFYCHQKAFKLKEDIRLYADDTKQRELLTIKARNIIDFSAAYDVTDPVSRRVIGTLRRKGWNSMIRDAWEVMDAQGRVIGKIEEDNLGLALARRLLSGIFMNLIPQAFHFTAPNGAEVAKAKQQFNPFIHKMDLEMPRGEQTRVLDPRIILAASVLLVLIEGRQN